jgi:hypothetical protein
VRAFDPVQRRGRHIPATILASFLTHLYDKVKLLF